MANLDSRVVVVAAAVLLVIVVFVVQYNLLACVSGAVAVGAGIGAS